MPMIRLNDPDHFFEQTGKGYPLMCVHWAFAGLMWGSTPQPDRYVEIFYDLFNNQKIAENSDKIKNTLQPASTAVFYTGSKRLLASYLLNQFGGVLPWTQLSRKKQGELYI
jgi:hypothetical protein